MLFYLPQKRMMIEVTPWSDASRGGDFLHYPNCIAIIAMSYFPLQR